MEITLEVCGCADNHGWAVEIEAYRERTGRGTERKACAPRPDPRHLPTADDTIQPTGDTAANPPPAAKGQIVDPVGVEDVGGVEVGVAPTDAEIPKITDQPAG